MACLKIEGRPTILSSGSKAHNVDEPTTAVAADVSLAKKVTTKYI